MRDDLHRTPALPRHWRTAIRHAARAADTDRIPYDLSRAVARDMEARLRPEWVEGLQQVCGGRVGQLFPETQVDALTTYERTARTPQEQRLVELTRAFIHRGSMQSDVVQSAKRALHAQMIDSGIEHATAAVRQQWGPNQSRELSERLHRHQSGCSLELGLQKPPKKLKGSDLLDLDVGRL